MLDIKTLFNPLVARKSPLCRFFWLFILLFSWSPGIGAQPYKNADLPDAMTFLDGSEKTDFKFMAPDDICRFQKDQQDLVLEWLNKIVSNNR